MANKYACYVFSVMVLIFGATRCAAQVTTPSGAIGTDCSRMSAQTTLSEFESRGDLLRSNKAYSEALVCYELALQRNRNNEVVLNKAGVAQLQMSKFDAARKYFEKAIKKNPNYAQAYNNLGVVFYTRNDYKKAVKQYKKALALDETSASFHSNLGTAFFAQKKTEKARIEYSRALELDPDVLVRSFSGGTAAQISSPADRANYAYLLARMYAKRGDVERCLHCLERAKLEGYQKIQETLKDPDFAAVRQDLRFSEILRVTPQP